MIYIILLLFLQLTCLVSISCQLWRSWTKRKSAGLLARTMVLRGVKPRAWQLGAVTSQLIPLANWPFCFWDLPLLWPFTGDTLAAFTPRQVWLFAFLLQRRPVCHRPCRPLPCGLCGENRCSSAPVGFMVFLGGG